MLSFLRTIMPAKTPNKLLPEVKKAESIRPGDSDPRSPGAQEPRGAGRKLPRSQEPGGDPTDDRIQEASSLGKPQELRRRAH